MYLPQILFPMFMFTFIFSLPLILTLLAASISHFLSSEMKFHVFLPTKFFSFVFNHSL